MAEHSEKKPTERTASGRASLIHQAWGRFTTCVQWFARIDPDETRYECKKDIKAFANTLAELAIERLGELSIDKTLKESIWIVGKPGEVLSAT